MRPGRREQGSLGAGNGHEWSFQRDTALLTPGSAPGENPLGHLPLLSAQPWELHVPSPRCPRALLPRLVLRGRRAPCAASQALASTDTLHLPAWQLPVEFLLLLTVPVVDPDKEDRNWKRPLNCLQLAVSPLVLVLTLQSGACE